MDVNLNINGRSVQVEGVDPDMPLLWVLRDRLGLMGTKYSCGVAKCGACLVLVDGEAVPSCVFRVADAQGSRITTIEGLGEPELHAVQQAWIEEDVSQCGYCQSGQIINAAALLSRSRHPTDAEIDGTMRRCLCRCGTYPRIRRAVHRAAGLLYGGEELPS